MPIGYQREIDNNPQSQTSQYFKYDLMIEDKTDILLTQAAAIHDEEVEVSAGHGFTVGSILAIFENNRLFQVPVTSVSTNTIGIAVPLTYAFTTAAKVLRGRTSINVDGSSAEVKARLELYNFTIPIDISSIIVDIVGTATVPDDGKFGSAAALTNGMVVHRYDGTHANLGLYKTNGDFRTYGGTVEYTDKAPAGAYGVNAYFDLDNVFKNETRLNPRNDDVIEAIIRDAMNVTGITDLKIHLLGSYTSGE